MLQFFTVVERYLLLNCSLCGIKVCTGNPVGRMSDVSTRNWLTALDRVDTRARLLGIGSLVEEAALDKYSFVRDIYLQRRSDDVFDGNVPAEPEPKK